ncbi:hypothetical protein KI387_014848, partial [Taxus chinensis]
ESIRSDQENPDLYLAEQRQVKRQEEFAGKGDQAQDCNWIPEPCDTQLIIGREISHLLC